MPSGPMPMTSGSVMVGDTPTGPIMMPGSGRPLEPGPIGRDWVIRTLQPYVILESVFLAPIHNTGGSVADYTFTGNGTASTNTKSVNGMIVTPRIALGVMGQRWGLGVRYWTFENDQGSDSFPTATSQGVFAQSLLKIQTFDLEGIRRIEYEDRKLWFSFGVRYAGFVRTSAVASNDYFANTIYTGSARREPLSTALARPWPSMACRP